MVLSGPFILLFKLLSKVSLLPKFIKLLYSIWLENMGIKINEYLYLSLLPDELKAYWAPGCSTGLKHKFILYYIVSSLAESLLAISHLDVSIAHADQ